MSSLPNAGEHAGAAAADATQPAHKSRRRQSTSRGNQQNWSKSKMVDLQSLELEEMELKDIQRMFPIVMELLFNVA
eukprot:5040438-Pyramimonas_sp.AAC.1